MYSPIECTLNSPAKTIDNVTAVKEGSELVAVCECQSGLNLSVVWILNNTVVDEDTINVTITSKEVTDSRITVNRISKQQEGSLCCRRGESFVCLQFRVVDPPVVTATLLSQQGCQSEVNSTETVAVKCAVSSHIRGDVAQGFMHLYLNNFATIAYDSVPVESSKTDRLGGKVWEKTFNFSRAVSTYRQSNFACHWTQEDGNKYVTEFTVRFEICSVPAQFTTTATVQAVVPDNGKKHLYSQTVGTRHICL